MLKQLLFRQFVLSRPFTVEQLLPRLCQVRTAHHGKTLLPIPPSISVLETPQDSTQARSWLSEFKTITLPRSVVELSFSRSSGPGGQVCDLYSSSIRCVRL